MSAAEAASLRQSPCEEAADRIWDVAVIGAGPAGSSAAICLSLGGRRVLLIDRAPFPREKVCGDGLISDTIKCLRNLNLYDSVRERGRRIESTVVYSPSRIELRVEGEFYTLQRRTLDFLLARRAVESGAFFVKGEVRAVTQRAEEAVLSLKEIGEPLRARSVIVAIGADCSLLRALAGSNLPEVSALAVRCYVQSPSTLEHMVVTFDKSIIPGYAWIFPLTDGLFNMGCGVFFRGGRKDRVNLRKMFDTFIKEFPVARDLMKGGAFVSPLKGAPLRCGFRGAPPIMGARVIAAGEALGTTFPFTGEGIGKAMETGSIAAAVVEEALKREEFGILSTYGERLEKDIRPRYLGYEVAEDWLSHGWLNDLIASRASRSPFLTHALEGVINESEDPREVFSLAGILRSFWS